MERKQDKKPKQSDVPMDSWGMWYQAREERLRAAREGQKRYFDICTGRMELCDKRSAF